DDATLGLARIGQRIAHEVHPAALPGGAQNLGDGALQPFMRVRDHQLHAAQATPRQAAQELHPERLGLTVADGQAEHFAPPVGVDPDGDDYRDRDDVVVAPGFDVGGVEPDVRPFALDRAGQEGLHALVDLAAQPRDLAFADALHAHGADQIVHRAGRDALDIGLLDHRRQRLLGQAAGFEKGRKIAAATQLRYAEFNRAGTGFPVTLTVAVALIAA